MIHNNTNLTLQQIEELPIIGETVNKWREVVRQAIEYTDFDLPEINIWIELGSLDGVNEAFIMMLPSER